MVSLGHPLPRLSSIPVIQTAVPRTDETTVMTAGITRIRGSGGMYLLQFEIVYAMTPMTDVLTFRIQDAEHSVVHRK